eukprot:TRINITY_DN9957_c0_g1_i3.p2 TRINITY_DN9957_c0_g1~~TRINITY_DN9957_c0_g1_i3.p2  ORF type:complete len:200 (-),score=19.35 TRINITY_DN9957_c0_g1_i3:11-610(-)
MVLLLGDSVTAWRQVVSDCILKYYQLCRWITIDFKVWEHAWNDRGVDVIKELQRYDLVFANQGLHYNAHDMERYRRFLAMAEEELLRLPAATRRKFIWVESTSQHYRGGTYNTAPQKSCKRLDRKSKNAALMRDIESTPAMSQSGIQIVPHVMDTLSAWDDHPSVRPDGRLDCTHFCSNGRTVKRQVERMLEVISAMLF